jgi:hypothetical protein
MKSLSIFSLLVFLTISNTLFSQITITDLSEKKVERIVSQPVPYDSLINWKEHEKKIDYKQYIGLQVYLPPCNSLEIYNYCFPQKTRKINDQIFDNYYTIINVLYGDTLEYLFDEVLKDPGRNNRPNLLYVLKNDKLPDTLYFDNNFNTWWGTSNLILVPYFVKQKQLYKDKQLIYTDEKGVRLDDSYFNGDLFIDDVLIRVTSENNAGQFETKAKKVILQRGSKWLCTDVTLMNYSKVYTKDCLKDDHTYSDKVEPNIYNIFFILKNDKNETIALNSLSPIRGLYEHNPEDYAFWGNRNIGFVFEMEYLKSKNEKKLQSQQLLAKQKQEDVLRKQKEKTEIAKRKTECIRLFGQTDGELIADRNLKIGMNEEMCKYSWGTPLWTDKITNGNGVFEVWNYWLGYKLYFQNNILKRIDE